MRPGYQGALRPGPKGTPPVEQLSIRLGYVEELTAGWLILTPSEPFPTLREALSHLGKVLAAIVQGRHYKALQPCCEKAPQEAKFCSKCGTRLHLDVKIFPDDLKELLREMLGGTADSLGSEIHDALEDQGWSIWEDPIQGPGSYLVTQYADDIIANLGLDLSLEIWQETELTK